MKCKLLLLLTLASPAFAGLIFTLNPPTGVGQPGDAIVFSGTLLDDDLDTSFLFLNAIAVSFTPPGGTFLSPDPNFFTQNVIGVLQSPPDIFPDSYSGPIFEIHVAPNTPAGTYFGTIDILGGHNSPDDSTVLATQRFQVVAGAPEPALGGLTLAALACLALARSRSQSRRA